MRKIFPLFIAVLLVSISLQAQKVIPLYNGKAPGSENWNWKEKSNDNNIWKTPIVYNVADPTLTVFEPVKGKSNGTAIIIAPGGGFQALSITKEGTDMAEWMAEKGVTAFVLKYRLNPSKTDDPATEFMAGLSDTVRMKKVRDTIIPMVIADGRKAIEYVRSNAKTYGIDPNKIGIVGFSAGGTVALGATLGYNELNRPNFSAPIYPYVGYFTNMVVPADAPPLFIAAATDDLFGFAPDCANLYNTWIKAKKSAELHIYSKGGHGFGMSKQNLPSDHWMNLFADWLVQINMLPKQ
jgi:acetyl esterase/lipase